MTQTVHTNDDVFVPDAGVEAAADDEASLLTQRQRANGARMSRDRRLDLVTRLRVDQAHLAVMRPD